MKDLYLVGAGGMGREILYQIQGMHLVYGPKWNIIGFLDDTPDPLKGKDCDYPVVGTIRDYVPAPNDVLLMCIAAPEAKRAIVPMLKARGAVFDSFISPWSYMGIHNNVGEGIVVYGGFSMTVNITIGNFATFLACQIGHDAVVGDFATISSKCSILGGAQVGEGAFIGDGALIAPHVSVGENAFVGIGSVVVKDVHAGEKVFGNPAKEIGI